MFSKFLALVTSENIWHKDSFMWLFWKCHKIMVSIIDVLELKYVIMNVGCINNIVSTISAEYVNNMAFVRILKVGGLWKVKVILSVTKKGIYNAG